MSAQQPARFHSTCPHDCPSSCALEVEVLDPRTIGRIYGAVDNDYTAGVICAKVARYAERVHHPDRLSRPLRRTGRKGAGLAAFETIAWDDALDIVAERFQAIIRESGGESIWPYHYAGTMGLVQRDGLDRLRHTARTSRQHSTFCVALSDAGWNVGVGAKRGADARNMVHSDLIVIWGGNPVSTQVNVMHYVAKARRLNQARLVVVDPYRTGTAAKADLHLMLRPGTDGALACAVMHILFRDGYADREYLERYTDVTPEFENHLRSRTPEWAAAITGLSVESIEHFASWYGLSQRSFIRAGYGFSRSRNGAVNMHAVTCLPAITGAWRHRGGGALYGQSALYDLNTLLLRGRDVLDTSTRELDQSRIGEVLCGNPLDLQGGPPVRAMLIQNTNPMVVAPDSRRVRTGFERDDLFVCVHEQFLTETAQMADIVLPATMFLEHDDLYVASGHTYLQVTRKLIEPYAECRSNHWVLQQLANRLGLEHEGFRLSEWELIDRTLRASGLPGADALHGQRWYDMALPFEATQFLEGFSQSDKRFHFRPDWSSVGPAHQGMPAWPDHWAVTEAPDAEHPFRLVAAPARQFLNTSFTETPTARRMEKQPRLLMHPDDCTEQALEPGARGHLGNSRGQVQLSLSPFDGVQRGVVVVESLWPNADFAAGEGINTLVSSEPGQPNGGAVYHDTAVWVRTAV